jgi:hypothetical protein
MNYREPFAWLIIVALIFFILWQGSQSKIAQLERMDGNRLAQQRIENLTRQAKTAGARADSLRASFNNRHTSDSLALSGLKMRNSTMSKKLAELRHPIVVMSDSVPLLKQFIQVTDSLLTQKDLIITHLELSHAAEVVDLEAIIKAREDQILVEATKGHLWEEVAVKTEKDYNKERRRKGFWKGCTAVAVGLCLFLAVK